MLDYEASLEAIRSFRTGARRAREAETEANDWKRLVDAWPKKPIAALIPSCHRRRLRAARFGRTELGALRGIECFAQGWPKIPGHPTR